MSDERYTPAYIFEAMNVRFDLDVASPGKHAVPWIPVDQCYTESSLERPWVGFIWCNPPYSGRSNGKLEWMRKFVDHGNGVTLMPDSTSAPWWQWVASNVDLILFVSPRIAFIGIDGLPETSPRNGSCLMAIGDKGCQALRNANYNGLGYLTY